MPPSKREAVPNIPLACTANTAEGNWRQVNEFSIAQLIKPWLKPEFAPQIDELEAYTQSPTHETMDNLTPDWKFGPMSKERYLLDIIMRLATGQTMPAERRQQVVDNIALRWRVNKDWPRIRDHIAWEKANPLEAAEMRRRFAGGGE